MAQTITDAERAKYFSILLMHDELIHEQRAEIAKLKNKVNQLQLKLQRRRQHGST